MRGLEERVMYLEGEAREQRVMVESTSDGLKVLRGEMNLRFDSMDAKMSRQFLWLVGIQVMTLVALVTSMAGILAALS